jgi:hypothetical protein
MHSYWLQWQAEPITELIQPPAQRGEMGAGDPLHRLRFGIGFGPAGGIHSRLSRTGSAAFRLFQVTRLFQHPSQRWGISRKAGYLRGRFIGTDYDQWGE